MTILVWAVVIVGFGSALHRRSTGDRARQRRQAEAEREVLPDAVEIVAVVLGSGGTMHEAFRTLAAAGPPALQPSLRRLHDRLRAGLPLGTAVAQWGDDIDPSYRSLVGAILTAERDGAPLSQLLGRLADEAVSARRITNETRARTLPVRLLFPVVLCALPAVIVGAIVPLVIVSLDRL